MATRYPWEGHTLRPTRHLLLVRERFAGLHAVGLLKRPARRPHLQREAVAQQVGYGGIQVKKQLFEELVESIQQAGRIHRGETQPSRRFVFEAQDIRGIREKLHKSQSEVARMIGVSVATLQNWEQGRRQP